MSSRHRRPQRHSPARWLVTIMLLGVIAGVSVLTGVPVSSKFALLRAGGGSAVAIQSGSASVAANPTPSTTTGAPTETPAEPATMPPTPAPTKPKPWRSQWVMGYYVGYERHDYPLDSVDFAGITHLAVGPAVPRSDGSVDTSFSLSAESGPVWAKTVVKRTHLKARKAILMLGGTNASDTYVGAASNANRARFVANLTEIVTSYGFDGIDLDWEPLREVDGTNLIALAKDLRKALPGKTLTIPLGPLMLSEPNSGVLSYYKELPKYFDQINLMSYGVSGNWSGWDSWHSSPLFGSSPSTPISINSSITALRQAGIPAAKLGIGIGFYGTCFTGVTGPNQTMKSASDGQALSYSTIMGSYYRASAQRWDAAAQVPYLSSTAGLGPGKCGFLSYENAESIKAKAAYVKKQQLGGAIIWNLNQGHLKNNPAGSRDPLLNAVRRHFRP